MSKIFMGFVLCIVICLSAMIGAFVGAFAGMISMPVTVVGWLYNDNASIPNTNDSI